MPPAYLEHCEGVSALLTIHHNNMHMLSYCMHITRHQSVQPSACSSGLSPQTTQEGRRQVLCPRRTNVREILKQNILFFHGKSFRCGGRQIRKDPSSDKELVLPRPDTHRGPENLTETQRGNLAFSVAGPFLWNGLPLDHSASPPGAHL